LQHHDNSTTDQTSVQSKGEESPNIEIGILGTPYIVTIAIKSTGQKSDYQADPKVTPTIDGYQTGALSLDSKANHSKKSSIKKDTSKQQFRNPGNV